MSETAAAPPPTGQRPASEPAAGGVITQHVRLAYWKYPIIALVLAVAIGLLGVFAGSPNSPRATIAATSRQDPGGAALAFTQELADTSAAASPRRWPGTGPRPPASRRRGRRATLRRSTPSPRPRWKAGWQPP